MKYLQNILLLLNKKEKISFVLLVVFSVFFAVIETVGISAIMPFIDIAINLDKVKDNKYYSAIYNFFGFQSEVNFAIFVGFCLIGFFAFRTIMTTIYAYTTASFVETVATDKKNQIFTKFTNMYYQDYVTKNIATLLKSIGDADGFKKATIGFMAMVSEVFTLVFLYSLMMLSNWKITLTFTVALGVILIIVVGVLSKEFKKISDKLNDMNVKSGRFRLSFLNNFKYVKLQTFAFIENTKANFSKFCIDEARLYTKSGTLSPMPKMLLEMAGFSLVVLFLMFLLFKYEQGIGYILPTLSLFVLALYRMLPSISRIVNAYNEVLLNYKASEVVQEVLDMDIEVLGKDKIKFSKTIELSDVEFHYRDGTKAINKISLVINKGSKVAFVGKSGAGKSTLVDMIAGLYSPDSGSIKLDGEKISDKNIQSWRTKIGYIPQQVYLFDGTVAENVCFGKEINKSKLEDVLKKANIFDFLQAKKGLQTRVGEGGVQLSGGQKQRIAIARALYGDPEVMILDEATSALDNETEKKIMEEMYKISKEKTLIIIAHRLSTIQGCDVIYEVSDGQILDSK